MSIAWVSHYRIKNFLSRQDRMAELILSKMPADTRRYIDFLSQLPITQDWCTRNGSFYDPWRRQTPITPELVIPELTSQNLKFAEICDLVAVKIVNRVNSDHRKLLIGYSGGVDSTALLVALLKNNIDKQKVVLLISSDSISENPVFYDNFIDNKLVCKDIKEFESEDHNYQNYYHSYGEFGDHLYIQSSPLKFHKSHSIPLTTKLTPYRDKIAEWMAPGDVDLRNWVNDQMERITSPCPIPLDTTGSFLWWWAFNGKWHDVYFRRSSALDIYGLIRKQDPAMFTKFKSCELDFYADPMFQIWSMQNIASGEILKDGLDVYRRFSKEYIYDYNKDRDYFLYKGKVDSGSKIASRLSEPLFIDGDLTTYYKKNTEQYSKLLYRLMY